MNQLPLTDDIIEQYVRIAEAGPHDRQRLLSALPPGPLRDTVSALLAAGDSSAAESLDHPFLELDRALGPPGDVDLPGETPPELGPRYTILRALGHGGHGDVYLARQERPVQRLVAIKTLRSADAGAAAVERMRREAGALAALDHPGIATVFDAGRAADGRPYLVTEYVDGPPIDTFCAEHNCDFRQRCQLVASLCDAVEHAHQRGIIHRDLKPTNILVAGDERPAAKIVDLGIARIVDPSSRGGPTLTHVGALLGTIGYMAPEQLRGEPADTRSDLYALGRVLQALLAPVEPPPRCRKDCAAIIRRATAPAAKNRYQSAGAFGADLRAMLADGPVAARRHSTRETLARLVRRRPAAAALLFALAATLFIGGGIVARQNAAASDARAMQKELLKSVLDHSVVNLSRYIGTIGERTDLATRLDAQLATMLLVSPDDPELHILRARVWTELARIRLASKDPQAAEPLARRAAQVMQQHIDPVAADVEQVRELGYAIVIWADMLTANGRTEAAAHRYREALRLHERAHERFPGHIGLLDDLTWSYDRAIERAADPAQRIQRARARRDLARKLLEMDPDRSLSQYGLAVAHIRLGQILQDAADPAAIVELEQARATLRPIVTADPLRWAYLDNLARACILCGKHYAREGRLQEARAAHAEAVAALFSAAAASAEPRVLDPLFSALTRLAGVCDQLDQPATADAARALRSAIESGDADWRVHATWLMLSADLDAGSSARGDASPAR